MSSNSCLVSTVWGHLKRSNQCFCMFYCKSKNSLQISLQWWCSTINSVVLLKIGFGLETGLKTTFWRSWSRLDCIFSVVFSRSWTTIVWILPVFPINYLIMSNLLFDRTKVSCLSAPLGRSCWSVVPPQAFRSGPEFFMSKTETIHGSYPVQKSVFDLFTCLYESFKELKHTETPVRSFKKTHAAHICT